MLLGHPLTDFPDAYRWNLHRHVKGLARLARRQRVRMERVRLPSRHDPHHPAGFTVITFPQWPGFRADLGLERTFPPAADIPSDHYFLEITVAFPSRRRPVVREICQYRVERGEGLDCLLKEVHRRLMAVHNAYYDPWWYSGTVR